MKKLLRFSAMLLGAFTTVSGVTACGNDDDGVDCCTYSYVDAGVTYTFKACSDGTYSYTTSDGYSYSGTWDTETYSWEQIRASAIAEGADCD